jgi:nicotinamide riboside transporter PnuC
LINRLIAVKLHNHEISDWIVNITNSKKRTAYAASLISFMILLVLVRDLGHSSVFQAIIGIMLFILYLPFIIGLIGFADKFTKKAQSSNSKEGRPRNGFKKVIRIIGSIGLVLTQILMAFTFLVGLMLTIGVISISLPLILLTFLAIKRIVKYGQEKRRKKATNNA